MRHSYRTLACLLVVGLLIGCGKIITDGGGACGTLHRHPSSQIEQLEPVTVGAESYSTDKGKAIGSARDSAAFQDCDWRKCEISEGPLACARSDHACDMYRNRCVPICTDDDCCDGVDCPEGTVCVPALGRCGIPAGEGCYDLGTDWWSGRDIPPERRPILEEAVPAVFEVYNDGETPLYLVSTLEHEARFDLYMTHCGRMRKLPLEVNHFCPTLCPEQGPPMEIDCDQPPSIMQRLPAGERLIINWSGLEQVGMWRICGASSVKYCLVDRVTLPGTYTLEICAYTSVEGGRPHADDPNWLIMANSAGERQCLQVKFQHPMTAPIVIRFGS